MILEVIAKEKEVSASVKKLQEDLSEVQTSFRAIGAGKVREVEAM